MDILAVKVPEGNRLDVTYDASDVPDGLHKAAESLTGLAYSGYGNEWRDISDAEHIVAQREAIALCRRALDEVELILDYSAYKAADYLRNELKRIESGLGVNA